ncbi:MAG: DUF2231 domain-containing protein [Leptonema sp. (in: bacteria)]
MFNLNFILLHSSGIKLNNVPPESPLHPFIVHFPIVLTILIPFLTIGILYFIKKYQLQEKESPIWSIILILNILNLIFSYMALFSGDVEHELLQHSPFLKQSIEQHETIAENFFISLIATLVFSFLSMKKFSFYKIMRVFLFITYFFVNIPLVLWTGYLGGKVVYEMDAPFFRKELIKEYKNSNQNK